MNAVERDDCIHAIGQVLGFFGKQLDSVQVRFWSDFLSDQDRDQFLAALRKYPSVGRYAPRPADIATLIAEERERSAPRYQRLDRPAPKPCPIEIENAWRYWLGVWFEFGGIIGKSPTPTDDAERDHWLEIVNREAQRSGTPESIPDDFKIGSIWRD